MSTIISEHIAEPKDVEARAEVDPIGATDARLVKLTFQSWGPVTIARMSPLEARELAAQLEAAASEAFQRQIEQERAAQ